jgi:hypothetical protein
LTTTLDFFQGEHSSLLSLLGSRNSCS